ncbi:MAG: NAD-dependent epimerase/dehydratase family protein [Balneolaceae bacterium]
MNILITGAAGFIGYHLTERLLSEGHDLTGVDNLNDYYATELKYGRLRSAGIDPDLVKRSADGESVRSQREDGMDWNFIRGELSDREMVESLFSDSKFDMVVHLAAQAGVRYSLENPHAYIESNVNAFLNILEGCRHHPVEHLVYASSSSVYGENKEVPFRTDHAVDHPVSLYAATKKSNELMAYTYAHLFGVPSTGLRFFTVYGSWGRPDMAYFKFADRITSGKSIDVYNHGEMERDFTFVGDIVESVARLVPKPPAGESGVPTQLFNIGHGSPVNLMDFIGELERQLGVKAKKRMMDMQPGDVPRTWADVEDLFDYIDYRPKVKLPEGIAEFLAWYSEYYGIELPSSRRSRSK